MKRLKQQVDPRAFGLTPLSIPATPRQRRAASNFTRRCGAKLNRQSVTQREWLFINRTCQRFPHGRYLEIGCYCHGSTCAFLGAMGDNDAGLVTVDVEYRRPDVAHPDPAVNSRWTKLTGPSLDVLPTLSPPFYVIFVDGLHTPDGVRHDVQQALRLIAKRGVIIAHDANNPRAMQAIIDGFGSSQAIDYYREEPDHCKGLAVYPKGWNPNG